jgi:hypothetical protein
MFNLPPSFCIVTLAFLAWIVTVLLTRRGRPLREAPMRKHHEHGDHHHPTHADLSV